MKIRIIAFLLYLGLFTPLVFAQQQNLPETTNNDTVMAKKTLLNKMLQKVTLYGFVRTDVFYNSRQNLELRDGVLDVYPLPPSISNGEDLRKQSQLGFSAIVTRLGLRFDGVKALGANASGLLETDFFGITNNTTFNTSGTTNQTLILGGTHNLLRLRHAYVKLEWSKISLLIGQHWNPNYISESAPSVSNFNTGIPFNPFGFLPQARVEYNFAKGFTLTGMVFGYSLAGFSSSVPSASTSTSDVGSTDINILSGVDAQKFSSIPSFALQMSYENQNWLVGIGAESNTLRPHTLDYFDPTTQMWGVGTAQSKFNKTFTGFNGLAYIKYTSQPVVAKVYANVGQSYTQYVGLGGFATYRSAKDGQFVYRPQNQLNLWTEIMVTKHSMFQPALFVGYNRNLGLAKKINADDVLGGSLTSNTVGFAGRAIGIGENSTYRDFLRIAPRLDVISGNLKFSLEYEWSHMVWGNSDLSTFRISEGSNISNADNHRILFIAVYNF